MNNFDYPFLRYPRALFSSPVFAQISIEARTLLAIILDRLELSQIHSERFSDENGEVYAVCTVEEVCKKLGCGTEKTIRIFKELENCGMLRRQRENRQAPYRIYITDAFYDILNSDVTSSEKPNSRTGGNRTSEFGKAEDSYTEYSNNNNSNNNSSIIVTDDEIKEKIEYECLWSEENAGVLDELVMIISDVLNGTSPTVRIGKDDMPRSIVVSRFRMIDSEDIVSVLWQLGRSKTIIRNMKSYLIMMLYNEVETRECELFALEAKLKADYGVG